MKLGSRGVIRVGVLPVEGEASSGGDLKTDLRVEPRYRSGRVESPMIEGNIGVSFLAPWANRDVEEAPDVPVPIPFMPANERIRERIAEISCAFIKGESTARLDRPV